MIPDALVETEKVGHVFMVGINRPESRNCVNPATALQLSEAFTEFECSEDLWVAVLYGKGEDQTESVVALTCFIVCVYWFRLRG